MGGTEAGQFVCGDGAEAERATCVTAGAEQGQLVSTDKAGDVGEVDQSPSEPTIKEAGQEMACIPPGVQVGQVTYMQAGAGHMESVVSAVTEGSQVMSYAPQGAQVGQMTYMQAGAAQVAYAAPLVS